MLDDFIVVNRDEIVERSRLRVAKRTHPKPTERELANGIPVFLDQLTAALQLAKSSKAVEHGAINTSAEKHGRDLLGMGLSIGQVVHDYGDVCQVITGLALEQAAPISGEEFRTLNLCLDDAIAGAVTAYQALRERNIANEGTERLGTLAHEIRNQLNTAILAFATIKSGVVAPSGSTSLILGRSLNRLRDLVDRSLAEVRLDAGTERREHMAVADLIEEIEIGATLQAQSRDVQLSFGSVDKTAWIEGDRQILAAAISNLLQNAFKFTRKQSHVTLSVRTTAERVLIDIEDECGGLPAGKAEELFQPFSQRGVDRTGVGLGLSISRKAAASADGELSVRDLPGKGCIFTLDLPRKPPPPLTVIDGGQTKTTGPTRAAK